MKTGSRGKTHTGTHNARVMIAQERPVEAVERSVTAVNAGNCKFKCGLRMHRWQTCPSFLAMDATRRWREVRKDNRCFLCLQKRRSQHQCRVTALCNVDECNKPHHPLLHPLGVTVHAVVNFAGRSTQNTFFKILPVMITAQNGQQERVLIMLDDGSSVSLMCGKLAERLDMKGPKGQLALSWFDGSINPAAQTKIMTFTLQNVVSGKSFEVMAHARQGVSLPRQQMTATILEQAGFQHSPVTLYEEGAALILIGQDNASLLRVLSSVEGSTADVTVSETLLGHVFSGEISTVTTTCMVANARADARMEAMLTRYIDDEHFGLRPDQEVKVMSDEDRLAFKIMEETTRQRPDGRYEVKLPFRHRLVSMPETRDYAERRFISFERKLRHNPTLQVKIRELMQSHIANEYVRKVPSDEAKPAPGQSFTIPVFNVHNPAKPDKVRLVFDCAAVVDGVSLNKELLTGPDFTVPLLHILQRFRCKKIGISADLKDMYHRVIVRPEDRPFLRFLWREQPEDEVAMYELCVLPFGATCSPSLAQYVKNKNAERFLGTYEKAVHAIQFEHYIDDWLGGAATEEEVIRLALQVQHIHQSAGFHMHKFMSNSRAVLVAMGASTTQEEVELSDSSILGMTWQTSSDLLKLRFRVDRFPVGWLDGTTRPTKRQMLSVVMSIYDPLGLVSYLTVEGRIVLREAWREQSDWDTPLSDMIQRRWSEWTRHLSQVKDVAVTRWHGNVDGDVELHVYADASETAIAAVCYVVRQGAHAIRSLVMAKCLVAPLKTKSIPRLELDAAVLAVRVLNMVRSADSWNVARVCMWTDAKDVLWWLRSSTRRYKSYVANRVSNILDSTQVEQWRWTPTHQNPADWATKFADREGKERLWWLGPEYLRHTEEEWPEYVGANPDQALELSPVMMMHVVARSRQTYAALVPEVTRFSSFTRLLRSAAVGIKFVRICRGEAFRGGIDASDLALAESTLFLLVQQATWTTTFQKFVQGLTSFEDQHGVLRMRGRLELVEGLNLNARFPVIVPNDHPVVTLLIMSVHQNNAHCHTSTVVNELRQRVIMPALRSTVKRVIGQCQYCCVRRAIPVPPMMSAVPPGRVASFLPPFSHVGIDYFGPLDIVIGRRREKRWGVLMTCLTTRAVYLEVAYSLSAKSCVAVLQSLMGRRGIPVVIYSDNATTFQGAAKEVTGRRDDPVWKFITPYCPSMGGAWERLVGVTKQVLTGLQLSRVPTEEQLRCCLLYTS